MPTPQTRLARAQLVLTCLNETFTFKEYAEWHPKHRSTAYRDWKRLISINFIQEIGCVNTDTRIPLYSRSQMR